MPTPPDPKKRMTIAPPAGAVLWSCWRVISKNRAAGESGRRERCTTEPGPNDEGRVRDAWPVSEWSTASVLAQWGAGKYRVDWYDAKGDRMKEFGALFDVADPPARAVRGPKLGRPPRPALDASDPTPMQQAAAQIASAPGAIGIVELLTLLKSEREDAREREQQASERQMQFMIQQQQQSTALLTALLQGKGTSSGDLELMRRELSQTMREEVFRLRQQVFAQPAEDPEDEPEDDPDAGPQDFGEAGERVAMSFMRQLENMAPEALPKVIDFINKKLAGGAGVTPPPNGRANGN